MKQTGDEYFDSNDFHQLLSTYETSINAGEPVFMDADDLVDIADYYQYTGKKDKAEEAITMALSLSPSAVAPLTYRIHEALYEGNTDRAWDYLNQIIDTDEPDYIYDKAEIMIAEGHIDEAEDYLRQILSTVDDDEQQDFIVDVANIFTGNGQPEKAMQWMTMVHQENSADFKELMARTLFSLGKYQDSERLFRELIDTDPFSKKYWNALASAQYMNQDYQNSIQSSEYAIAIDPENPEGLLAKANGLYRLDNFEEALKYYQRYSEQIPEDEFALLYQGTCLLSLNRVEEAINILQKALYTAPKDSPYTSEICQELAFAYSEQNEVDKAIEILNKTDELDCDHIHIMVIKGHVLLAAERLDEAEKMFHKAIGMSDDPRQTLLRIIVSFYDNKYLQAAYKLFKNYFAYYGNDDEGTPITEGYAYMAQCCYDLHYNDEFLENLKKACEINPEESQQVLGHLFPKEMKPEEYYNFIKGKMKE